MELSTSYPHSYPHQESVNLTEKKSFLPVRRRKGIILLIARYHLQRSEDFVISRGLWWGIVV